MSLPVIEVSGLGKKFVIDHQQSKRRDTFRDVITDKAARLLTTSKNLITSERNRKDYPAKEDFWALHDVSFTVEKGDRLGIIGRNGAGKSTLLKLLSRITEPTTGSISIRGKVASLLEVGTGFHPELSGRENIFLNGAILGMSRADIRRKFDEIVDFAEIEKFLDTPVKRYSSGMYVRLAFAVAAHLEPEILIIDEVLAVGDSQFQAKCLGKMDDVSRNEGRTILFVSHNISAIRNLTGKSMYLKNGKLEAIGNTNSIVDQYFQDNISAASKTKGLEFYRRQHRNALASFLSVKVNGSENEFVSVDMNADITIEMQIQVEYEITGTIFNMIIKNTDGETATTIASHDYGFVNHFENGLHKLTAGFGENKFSPGKYFATIAISPENGGLSYDVLIDYPLFQIKNDGRIVHWLDRPFGSFFINDVHWDRESMVEASQPV